MTGKSNHIMKYIFIPAALCATQLVAVAGPATSESALITTPPASSPWEFRITPYAWLTAIDGSTGPTGFVSDIDAGFDDIFDVLK